jgi:alcohol dehydrogenase (NADP+)
MIDSHGYAAQEVGGRLAPFAFQRRDAGPADVVLEVLHCGICHSDIHFVNNDWGFSKYPIVPGHEIVGRVVSVGADVTKFGVGDIAGIGCLVNSCRECGACKDDQEQACEQFATPTYGGFERGTKIPTYGGYSNNYVIDEHFAVKISPNLDPAAAAPLLCAGITTYSPLRHWGIGAGHRVGVVGLGGLGHMALKLATAMGAHVVMFTTSPGKAEDARSLGADEVVISTDKSQMRQQYGSLDFIVDTVSATHDLNVLLNCLRRDATMCLVGMPATPSPVSAMALAGGRKRLSGSAIGGIAETQEMMDFCAANGIAADIEPIEMREVNEAYERILRNEVKYRYVIDLASLDA